MTKNEIIVILAQAEADAQGEHFGAYYDDYMTDAEFVYNRLVETGVLAQEDS